METVEPDNLGSEERPTEGDRRDGGNRIGTTVWSQTSWVIDAEDRGHFNGQ